MTDQGTDAATALALGRRDRQEDAAIADFAQGTRDGFAILSDGMGGHDDGDLASRLIVSEVFGALSLSGRSEAAGTGDVPARLRHAVLTANQRLCDEVGAGAGQDGMGGTVIAVHIGAGQLRWISIGDSALYLFRRGRLVRLNEVHSLAPQIDLLVEQGVIDAETARTHPQRDCLTSALVGGAINRIDCPDGSFPLDPGDIILLASDGLLVLGESVIAHLLRRHRKRPAARIAASLLRAVAFLDEPEQDNVAVVVIKPDVRAESAPLPRGLGAWIARVRARLAPARCAMPTLPQAAPARRTSP